MLNTELLHELREQALAELDRPPIRFVDLDPRVLIELVEIAEVMMNQKLKLQEMFPSLPIATTIWRCPDHSTGTVSYEHLARDPGGVISTATCDQCGRTSR